MVNNVSFKYDAVIFQIEDTGNGADLQIDSNDCTFVLSLKREDIVKLFYKLRYFVEKNYLETKEKSEVEEFCLTGKVPKTQFQSTVEEMRKFLYSMTVRDAGLFRKESSMTNLFQDNGDFASTKDTNSTSPNKNG